MVAQDLRRREISDWTWAGLVAIGLTSFLLDILGSPQQATATLFLFSLATGIWLGLCIYLTGWLPSGDALAIIGLSTITYDLLPIPFIAVMLIPISVIGLVYALIQGRLKNRVDVPYMVPIMAGFLASLAYF